VTVCVLDAAAAAAATYSRISRWTRPIGCHTFRAAGITAYLENGGTLEHAESIAAHESPRTTKLYDRTRERLTREEVERIRL
jgi:integrase